MLAGSTTNLRAQMVFTKAMDPFPTEILQVGTPVLVCCPYLSQAYTRASCLLVDRDRVAVFLNVFKRLCQTA